MRSESEIRWVRAITVVPADNVVGQNEVATDWHAIVPGGGKGWPGVACGTDLEGTLQFLPIVGDGKAHTKCATAVKRFLKGLDPDPGPYVPDDEPPVLAKP